MTIEENDFKLESCKDGKHWDLEVKKIINAGKANEREELNNFGYGLTLSTAMKRIANYRMEKKHPEESITMKQYIKEYKEILNVLNQDYLK